MDKNVNIYFKVEGLDGYITNLEDLQQALNGVDVATKKADDATKQLNKAGEDFDSFTDKLELAEGSVKTLAGSFEILAGSAALLGLEDNAFFSELEENVIGVLTLSQGAIDAAEGIKLLAQNQKLAAIAQKAFNAAANANPYVVLASAVIALAGALALFRTRADEAEAAQGRLNKTFNEIAERERGQIEFERELARVRGELTPEKDIELNKQLIETYGQEILQSRARIEAAKIGEVTEEEQELIDRLEENISKRQEQIRQAQRNNTLIQERTKAELKAAEAEAEAERQRVANEKAAEARHQREIARIAAEQLAKQNATDAENEIFENQAELEDFLYRESLERREQEAYDLQESYYERLNQAEGNAELIQQVENWYRDQKVAQQAEWDAEDAENLKTKLEQEQAIRDEYAQKEIQATEDLQEAKANAVRAGFAVLDSLASENQKLSDAIFIAQQAFEAARIFTKAKADIAEARSNTFKEVGILSTKAAAGDLISASLIPGTISAGVSTVQALRVNAAAGIAGILAASISRFKGGGGGTDVDSGGNGGPNPGVAINYSFGQQAGQEIGIGQTSTGQQAPTITYVLASDVTNAQQAQQQISNLSKL
jgi:hypothetical protein